MVDRIKNLRQPDFALTLSKLFYASWLKNVYSHQIPVHYVSEQTQCSQTKPVPNNVSHLYIVYLIRINTYTYLSSKSY